MEAQFSVAKPGKSMDKSKFDAVIKAGKRTVKQPPVKMQLSGDAGRRVVASAAKRVINTHSEVIKALAKK